MPRRRESPYDPLIRLPHGVASGAAQRETAIGTLMECAPGEDPQTSQEELLPLRDVLQDAIEALNEREQWVFNACVVERRSLRSVGRDLSLTKSQVHRIRNQALERLRRLLEDQPIVKEYLDGQFGGAGHEPEDGWAEGPETGPLRLDPAESD